MSTDTDAIREKLRQAAASGSLASVGFYYWDRGGPPGAGYESDLLVLRLAGAEPVAELERKRFDPAFSPPFRVEEYSERVDAATVRPLAAQLERAFARTFPEETQVPIADVTKITISAFSGDKEISKTFHERLPEDLRELGELVRARLDALAANVPRVHGPPQP
ncbi:MAG: hypothetical protein IT372_09875 [Polyangiaceae bacterium]|nr:hypothetical protein [Polyangiaceae bacterium]